VISCSDWLDAASGLPTGVQYLFSFVDNGVEVYMSDVMSTPSILSFFYFFVTPIKLGRKNSKSSVNIYTIEPLNLVFRPRFGRNNSFNI